MEWFLSLIVFGGAYLIGSIPAALFLSAFNKEARQTKSGETGRHHIYRINKKRWTWALISGFNFGKGLLTAYLTLKFFPGDFYLLLSAIMGLLLGEAFPIWSGFNGGSGLDAAAGALFLVNPFLILIWAALFLTFYLFLRQRVIAALIAIFVLPLIIFLTRHIYFTDNTLLLILPVSMLIFQRILERVPDLVREKSVKIQSGEG
ncbi:glycerol-3-phosphate acyltransferase [Calditrichota bacterium GD2]